MNVMESIFQYFDGYKDFLDIIRLRSNAATIFHAERSKKIYEDICDLFISVFNNVKIVSVRSTNNAILSGAQLAQSHMNSILISDLQVLSDIFSDVKRLIIKRRQDLLNKSVFTITGDSLLSHNIFLDRFNEYLYTLKRPTFRLSNDMIDGGAGLNHINMITHLRSTVYKSVHEYVTQLEKFYDDQWMICYAMLSTDSVLRDHLTKISLVSAERKRAELRVCSRKYQLYMKMYDNYFCTRSTGKARLDIRVGSEAFAGNLFNP